jgi:hypothetical protein
MSGILGALAGASSGYASSTYLMGVGAGGTSSKFFTSWNYGYTFDSASMIYPGQNGFLVPSTRINVETAEIAYFTQSTGSFGILYDLVWTTISGLASKVNLDGVQYLMSDAGLASGASAAVTLSIATPGVVTWSSNTVVVGDTIMFTTTGALPTGLTPNTVYFVQAIVTSGNTFNIAATKGGAAIAFSGTQSGTHTAYLRPRRRFTVAGAPSTNPSWARQPVAPTANTSNPVTFTSTGHGFTNGQTVGFTTTGSLPSGLSPNTQYYIVNAAANTFQVSATSGGAALGNGAIKSGTYLCMRTITVIVS